MVEKRADGKVETEATIKIWLDGERYVRTAEGNGPVNALDRALRDGDRRDPPAPARHRARQLQGAHPRRDEGHRRGHARADRRLRRARRVGLDRRLRERRSRPPGTRSSTRSSTACSRRRPRRSRGGGGERRELHARRAASRRAAAGADPARAAGAGRGGGAGGARGAALGAALARAAPGRVRAALRRARRRAAARAPSRSGTAGLHLALRAVGVRDGDEVITSPFSFVASANAALYERARPVFADIDPVHAEPRPGGRRGGRHASARRRCCRCTSSATPPTCPRSSALARGTAWRSSRTPARRSARATPTASRSARAGTRRCSASTPTSS